MTRTLSFLGICGALLATIFITITSASAAATTLQTGNGGTGTTTWQTSSLPYFNGTYFTEKNANYNFSAAGNLFTVTNASTTALSATTICITGDLPCRTTWPTSGGSGSGTISTSSALTAPQVLYATGVSTAASAATSTLSGTANQITLSNSPFIIGASGAVISLPSLVIFPGNASTSLLSVTNRAYFGGTATSTFLSTGTLLLGTTTPLTAASLYVSATSSQSQTNKIFDVASTTGTSLFNINGAGTVVTSLGTGCVLSTSGTLSVSGSGCNAGTVTSVGLSDSNSTLTIGGTPVTVSGTLTATLNLAHSNQWSVLQDFRGNASTTIFSALGPAYFGTSATSSFSTAGALTLATQLTVGNGGTGQTTFTSSNLLYGIGSGAIQSVATSTSGTASTVMFLDSSQHVTIPNASTTALSINGDTTTGKRYLTFTYATTTAWTGTTTLLQLGIAPIGFTFSAAQCATDAGTLNIQYQYGTGPTLVLPMIPASTTVGTTNFTSNNTPVSPNVIGVKAGTPASSPTTVTCTVTAKQT